MLLPDATLHQVRVYLEIELRKLCSPGEAASIARLILEHVGYPHHLLPLNRFDRPGSAIVSQIKEIVSEINTGKPIQYILGYTYFFDLKIFLDEQVLIPRPETEELVYKIVSVPHCNPSRILDLGTGSGCIALALKKSYPGAYVAGVDNSREALRMAIKNSRDHELEIDWIESDLLRGSHVEIPGQMDLIVSNPPYVRQKEQRLMQANVLDFEPHQALFVPDGEPLVFYQAIASVAGEKLKPDGVVWVEINEELAGETAQVFEDSGYHVIIMKDIHGKERFIRAD